MKQRLTQTEVTCTGACSRKKKKLILHGVGLGILIPAARDVSDLYHLGILSNVYAGLSKNNQHKPYPRWKGRNDNSGLKLCPIKDRLSFSLFAEQLWWASNLNLPWNHLTNFSKWEENNMSLLYVIWIDL